MARRVDRSRTDPTSSDSATEVAAVPARSLISRFLPVAAITVGLLVAAPASEAKQKKKDKPVIAKIALGDKRVKKAHASAGKKKPKAKISQTLAPCQNTDVLPTAANIELVRAAVLCLHNQIRAQNKLPLLKDNAKLRKAATSHSNAMVGEGFFDHTSPDGDTFVDRIIGAGYAKRNDGWTLGENLAWGTGDLSSATGIMNAWMNSAGHKANILKKAYQEVGIGIKLGVPSDNGVGATITADFGARL
jgi:uncharacterized protein YkwD